MKQIKYIFSLVAFMLASTFAFAGDFGDVSLDQLQKAIDSDSVTIIDVNGSSSYAKGHIPTAIDFASVKDLSSVLPEDKNALIVAYCGGPRCGAYQKAAKAAQKLGYKNVKHLSAGISGWKGAGLPVEKQ